MNKQKAYELIEETFKDDEQFGTLRTDSYMRAFFKNLVDTLVDEPQPDGKKLWKVVYDSVHNSKGIYPECWHDSSEATKAHILSIIPADCPEAVRKAIEGA